MELVAHAQVAHSQRREGKEISQNRCGLQVEQPIPPMTPYEPWNGKCRPHGAPARMQKHARP